jgi:branched-chain amino acid transport system ATP-binding protein
MTQLPSSRQAGAGTPPAGPILELTGIDAGYGRTSVLHDINLLVERGSLVALLGSNGAGKTTLLKTAAGLLKPSAGAIAIDGADMTHAAPHRRARAGLCHIPEGRGIFRGLSVRDNLRMQVPVWEKDKSFDRAVEAFPVIGKRMNQLAGTMSGGQQQMLALCRPYLARPKVVLLDEVSMGLAPKVVDEIFDALSRLASTGVALLLVEQYIGRALDLADHVVLLGRGHVRFDGPATDLKHDAVLRGYLGVDTSASATP